MDPGIGEGELYAGCVRNVAQSRTPVNDSRSSENVVRAMDRERSAKPDDTPLLPLSALAPAFTWLHERGVTGSRLGVLFGTNSNHARQLVYRGKNECSKRIPLSTIDPIADPDRSVREIVGVRAHEDSVVLDGAEKARLERLDCEVDKVASGFWQGVRFERSVPRLRAFLGLVGYPAHHRRIRLLARVRQLISETHLHSGSTGSSIGEGIRALLLSRIAFAESGDLSDLGQVARTARLISQAYIIRNEVDHARRYLDIYRTASQQAGMILRPEYFHQAGVLAIQTGNGRGAKSLLTEAMNRLSETVDYGQLPQPHEVHDIGCRQINFVETNWELSQELLKTALERYLPGDIHLSINVCWTAATGFSTDSAAVHQQASDLLALHAGVADGYGRQATCYRLLGIIPELPISVRREFALFALFQNAFRNH